jgi:hypothetical protein
MISLIVIIIIIIIIIIVVVFVVFFCIVTVIIVIVVVVVAQRTSCCVRRDFQKQCQPSLSHCPDENITANNALIEESLSVKRDRTSFASRKPIYKREFDVEGNVQTEPCFVFVTCIIHEFSLSPDESI